MGSLVVTLLTLYVSSLYYEFDCDVRLCSCVYILTLCVCVGNYDLFEHRHVRARQLSRPQESGGEIDVCAYFPLYLCI